MSDPYIGGSIFNNIRVDERVTKDLDHCLFCEVYSEGTVILYKIPLDCINGNMFKQCPACKKIYILKDILE